MQLGDIGIRLRDAIDRLDEHAIRAIVISHPGILKEPVGVNDRSPLHLAATLPSSISKILIENGADPNCDLPGYTPLLDAASEGSVETVDLLINSGADVNARSKGGYTPLFCAATSRLDDRGDVVDLLIRSGATWDIHSASYLGRYDVCYQLLSSTGCSVLENAPLSSSVLATAVLTGAPLDIVRQLIGCGASPDGDPSRAAPLISLLGHRNPNIDTIRLLLECGANPNVRSPSGNTALSHHLKSAPDRDVVQLLKQYGAHE